MTVISCSCQPVALETYCIVLATKCPLDFNAYISTLLFWQICTPLTQQPHVINTRTDTSSAVCLFAAWFLLSPEPLLMSPETSFPGAGNYSFLFFLEDRLTFATMATTAKCFLSDFFSFRVPSLQRYSRSFWVFQNLVLKNLSLSIISFYYK